MSVLVIIPARGGSRRIPGKNIKEMCGKPLIAWSIEAAKKSKKVDKVIVSTDDKEIAEVAKNYGAEVPFMRPAHLANDTIGLEPVMIHAIEWLKENQNYNPDIVVLFPLTNPLKITKHLDEAIDLLEKTSADSVVAVSEALGNNNPHWILKQDEKGNVCLSTGESLKNIITRSQDLPKHYSRNDILYVLRSKNLYENPSNIYGNKVKLLVMEEIYYTDINTYEDWEITSNKLKRLHKI